jgi:hypothetical protein
MIRPFTCIAALLAFGSGLYLYQTKHQAQVLDKQIEHTVKAITATRIQARELAAAWTLLGSPDRLQQLSDQFLEIKPVLPGQFVAMADLDSRLPAPRPLPPPSSAVPDDDGTATGPIATTDSAAMPDVWTPLTQPATAPGGVVPGTAIGTGAVPAAGVSTAGAPGTATPRAVVATSLPAPTPAADPAKATLMATPARQADRKPSDAARPAHDVAQGRDASPPRVAPANAIPQRPASPSPMMAELDRPVQPAPQRLAAPSPMTGSLLGMAHASSRPPAPLPVSTSAASSNGN